MSEEINILEYVRVIYRRRWIVVTFVIVGLLVGVTYALVSTSLYRAQASIIPSAAEGSGIALPAGLAGFAGAMGVPMSNDPSRRALTLLESRALAELVVKKFDLIPVLYDIPESLSPEEREREIKKIPLYKAAESLRGMMSFEEARQAGTVEIAAVSVKPELTVDLIRWYLEGFREFINQESMMKSRHKRVNLEAQILRNQVELLEATKLISDFYEKTSISGVDSKVDVTINSSAVVNDTGISVAYGDQNESGPDVGEQSDSSSFDLGEIRMKEKKLEERTRGVIVKDVPQQAYLEYLMGRLALLRQLQGTLVQQYENTKVEEASAIAGFSLLDAPSLPARPWKPNRTMAINVSLLSSFFLSLFVVLGWEYIHRLRVGERHL
ncbi:MAG: hypothetical protein HYW02_02760 [Deltaproteobacteria bacterium]|nr:hypothetical protein [Deltaproteobacteria bacterium]